MPIVPGVGVCVCVCCIWLCMCLYVPSCFFVFMCVYMYRCSEGRDMRFYTGRNSLVCQSCLVCVCVCVCVCVYCVWVVFNVYVFICTVVFCVFMCVYMHRFSEGSVVRFSKGMNSLVRQSYRKHDLCVVFHSVYVHMCVFVLVEVWSSRKP